MSLIGLLNDTLRPDAIGSIGQRIGADAGTTGNAVSAALPLLIAALARNAAEPGGAAALTTALQSDHDGGLLDDIGGVLARGPGAGAGGMLRHILGERQPAVERGLSETTGLAQSKVGPLLSTLAPIVLAGLGRMRQERQLDAGGVRTLLTAEREHLNGAAPGALAALERFLDHNHYGSVSDDVGSLLGSLFGAGR